MNIDYIVVQAGGRGSRMEYLTDNKPKALVPVHNLPILFHLFNKFPMKKFIIISDYKYDVMEKYLDAFANVKYLLVDGKGKKGTCAGIRSALDVIPEKSQFMIIWSDLILTDSFQMPQENINYIGISKTFKCRWRYHEKKFEEISSKDEGIAGMFIFTNKNDILDVPEEGEFVGWLQQKNLKFQTLDLFCTNECGLLSVWNQMSDNNGDSRCRPFNRMLIENDIVTKEGIDEQGKRLSIREQQWYMYAQKRGFKKIPQIYSFNPLKMQYIHGHNIFTYSFAHEKKKEIVTKLVDCLKELHNLGSTETDYFSLENAYLGKTFNRLKKIRDLVPFSNEKKIIVNGKECRNIFFYQEEVRNLFADYKCEQFKFIHGDNTFSNIMLDENENPVLIDPRGYFGYTELFGDVAYDWAKLYYSIVGNYDKFNIKHFKLDIGQNEVKLNIESNGWEDVKDDFLRMVGDETEERVIEMIHAIIWLSLTTYAWEDYDSICGAFYNGLWHLEDVLNKR